MKKDPILCSYVTLTSLSSKVDREYIFMDIYYELSEYPYYMLFGTSNGWQSVISPEKDMGNTRYT